MADNVMKVTAPDGAEYSLNELLTVSAIQEIFGNVTKVTVYNWLGKADENGCYPDGKFPHAFKFGGMIYIPAIDVRNNIKNRQTKL